MQRRGLIPWAPLVLLLIVLSILPSPPIAVGQEAQPVLKIFLTPPVLPADGGSHPNLVVQLSKADSTPIVARSDLVARLSSSRVEVGSVDPSVTIRTGRSYAIANFTSTLLPGTSVITASSIGFQSASATETTVAPGGIPSRLKLTLGPSSFIPDPAFEAISAVQLVDDQGLPARALNDVVVSLASASPSIATVESQVLIPSGSIFTTARVKPTNRAGTATITASASGFESTSAILTTIGNLPSRLSVAAVPAKVEAGDGAWTLVVVSLADEKGRPVKAPDETEAFLTVDNTSVGNLESSRLLVRAGLSHATTRFFTRSAGRAVITASAVGHQSHSTTVEIIRAFSTQIGSLDLQLGTARVLPDNSSYATVVVQLHQPKEVPAKAFSDTTVILTSSNSLIGSINQTVTIKSGSSFTVATFRSTFLPGTTTIFATADNFARASAELESVGLVLVKLELQVVPPEIPADGRAYRSVVVQLLDSLGNPNRAPSDVVVELTSSRREIGTIEPTVTIRKGASFTVSSFQTSFTAGRSNITVSATGYESSTRGISTREPSPSKLGVFVGPDKIPADAKSHSIVAVQIQDSLGRPVRSRTKVDVTLSSSSPHIGVEEQITIPAGSSFARVRVLVSDTPSSGVLTAQASGFSSASAKLQTIVFPMSAKVTASPSRVNATDTSTITVSVVSEGLPLEDASLTWSVRNGQLANASRSTDASGIGRAVLFSPVPANSTVSLSISKLTFKGVAASANVTFIPLAIKLEVTTEPRTVRVGTPASVTVMVKAKGLPLQGARVNWTRNFGFLTNPSPVTDATGRATAVFASDRNGTAVVNIKVSKQFYIHAGFNQTIVVTGTLPRPPATEEKPPAKPKEQPPSLLPLEPAIIAGIAGAAVAGFLAIRIRKRRRVAGGEEMI